MSGCTKMELYEKVDGRGRLGWWGRNWRWLRIGAVLAVVLGFLGILLGWWVVEMELEGAVPRAPMGARVEVPDTIPAVDLTGKKLVALTFDDGPSAATTPRLLDVLQGKGVRATFFVLGTSARENAEIVLREVREGHEVESHSMYHKNLSKLSGEEVAADVGEARGVIEGITGKKVELVRPPYGATGGDVLGSLGAPAMLWSVDTLDWKSRDAGAVAGEVKGAVFDGAVVLMHDIYDSTVDAVGVVIDELRGQGYEFVTVSEMARARGVQMEVGRSYGGFRP